MFHKQKAQDLVRIWHYYFLFNILADGIGLIVDYQKQNILKVLTKTALAVVIFCYLRSQPKLDKRTMLKYYEIFSVITHALVTYARLKEYGISSYSVLSTSMMTMVTYNLLVNQTRKLIILMSYSMFLLFYLYNQKEVAGWQTLFKFSLNLVLLLNTQKVDRNFTLNYLGKLQKRLKEKEKITE